MFHNDSKSQCEETNLSENLLPIIVTNIKCYDFYIIQIDKINNLLKINENNEKFELQLFKEIDWTKFKNQYHKQKETDLTSTNEDDDLIVDPNQINPNLIITGGKIKNDYSLNNNFIRNKRERDQDEKFKNEKDKIKDENLITIGRKKSNGNLNRNNNNKFHQNSNSQKKLQKQENFIKKIKYAKENNNNFNSNNFIENHIESLIQKQYDNFHCDEVDQEFFNKFKIMNKMMNMKIFVDMYQTLCGTFNIKNNKENSERINIKNELSEEKKFEMKMKIENFNLLQLNAMRSYLPEKLRKSDQLNFRFEDIPKKNFKKLKNYVDDCHLINTKNKDHVNWFTQNKINAETKKKSEINFEDENQNENDNYECPKSPNAFMCPRNRLLIDDSISQSISSGSEDEDEDRSLSDLYNNNYINSNSNGHHIVINNMPNSDDYINSDDSSKEEINNRNNHNENNESTSLFSPNQITNCNTNWNRIGKINENPLNNVKINQDNINSTTYDFN